MQISKFRSVITFKIPHEDKNTGEPYVIPNNDELNELLESFQIQPCGALEAFRNGFAPVNGTEFVISSGKFLYLEYQENKKTIPLKAINIEVGKIADKLAKEEDRVIGRKERAEIRDRVIIKHLPTVLETSNNIGIIIDTEAGYVHIDTPSVANAEEAVSKIRTALGTFPVRPVEYKSLVSDRIANWIKDPNLCMSGFLIADRCRLLRNSEYGGGDVTFKDSDLGDSNVIELLSLHYKPAMISLYNDISSLDININNAGYPTLRRVKMSHILEEKERMGVLEEGDDLANALADIMIIGEFVSSVIKSMEEAFN